jgi:hypothetical protein
MNPYLDTEDTYYFNYKELIKTSKIITNLAEPKAKQKSKRDYAGIGAIIFTFFLIAIVTALTIYTFIEIVYGSTFQIHSKDSFICPPFQQGYSPQECELRSH